MTFSDAKTVYILGAGSSFPYGFPTGIMLKDLILSNGNQGGNPLNNSPSFISNQTLPESYSKFKSWMIKEFLGGNHQKLHDFMDAFRKSGSLSIDTFLSKNVSTNNFGMIGKLLIAFYISYYENEDHLRKYSNDWIEYFIYRNISYNLESFFNTPPAIITFNYDTLFQNKIAYNLGLEHGIEKPIEYINSNMEIIHVYGKIDEFYYGLENRNSESFYIHLHNKIRNLKIIGEDRDSLDKTERIQTLIKNADQVIILGYGFDRFNNKILFNDKNTFFGVSKKIYATGHKLPKAIFKELSSSYKMHIFDDTCRTLLEDHALPPKLFP